MTSVAFAGAGWITAIHGLAAQGVEGLRITRVASRHRAHARGRARQTGAVACEYEDLPGGADVVVVATPPALHLREAKRAVDGGAVALVEAPLAATLADADELVAAGAGGRIAYAENLLWAPAVGEVVSGRRRIGEPTYLQVRITQGRPEWRGIPGPDWGGGVLFDLGVHAVALALLLAAPAQVVAVEARLDSGADLEVDDDATAFLRFDSGLRAEVHVSWRATTPVWDAQAATPSGAVRLELFPYQTAELNGVALRLPEPPAGLPSPQLHHLGYVGQLAAVANDARHGHRPTVGPELGRRVLDIVCAAYRAAATGEPEPVPFSGPRDQTPHQLWRGA